jgi:hypothetical protein
MIGPSDLHRVPRWTPERQSEELRRYVASELGGGFPVVIRPTPDVRPPRGGRLWLTSLNPFARSASVSQASPLRPNLAAVHFQEEAELSSRGSRTAPSEAVAVFATPARVFSVRAEDGCPDERHACQ